MTPSDSRLCSTGWLWIPNPASGHDPRTPGLPGSSVFLSPRAVLTYPGEPNDCTCLCLRHPCWLHPIWKVGHSHLCVSRPSSGSLIATARVVRLPRLRRTDCSHPPLGQLHVSQAFHMVSSSQPTRKTRLGLAHQIPQIPQILRSGRPGSKHTLATFGPLSFRAQSRACPERSRRESLSVSGRGDAGEDPALPPDCFTWPAPQGDPSTTLGMTESPCLQAHRLHADQ